MICDELPAVTTPSGLKAGLRLASVSTVVPGRMPSSAVSISSVSMSSPVSLSRGLAWTGMISLSKRPSSVARSARCWLLGAEGVEVLAGEAPLLGDDLGRDALGHEAADVGVAQAHGVAEREADVLDHGRGAHRHEAHDLDAGGDDDVVGAGHDALGGEVGRLLGRAALAVDGGGGHRLGPAGGEHGVAADVERLGADLHDAAHDHVVDQGGVEVVALDERLERLGGEVDRVPARELAVALAAGGADGVDDDCGGHVLAPLVVLRRPSGQRCPGRQRATRRSTDTALSPETRPFGQVCRPTSVAGARGGQPGPRAIRRRLAVQRDVGDAVRGTGDQGVP